MNKLFSLNVKNRKRKKNLAKKGENHTDHEEDTLPSSE